MSRQTRQTIRQQYPNGGRLEAHGICTAERAENAEKKLVWAAMFEHVGAWPKFPKAPGHLSMGAFHCAGEI